MEEGFDTSPQIDVSQGWCCDGRTYSEHAAEGGGCCQPEGAQVSDLPPEGQRAAEERLSHS